MEKHNLCETSPTLQKHNAFENALITKVYNANFVIITVRQIKMILFLF